MTTLLAATPLLLVLIAMGGLHWSAARAGTLGLAAAVLLAATVFDITGPGIGQDVGGDQRPHDVGVVATGIALEALHATAVILWIILPALMLFEYQKRSGGLERIRDALSHMTADPRLQALLIAWFFGLFMEGAAGFGTPVALAAPLLVGIGFSPVRAVALALLGHAAGVCFGAVGTPALTQVAMTDIDPLALSATTAVICAVVGLGLALLVSQLAAAGPMSATALGWTLSAWAGFAIPFLALAVWAGPELPTLAAGLIGLALFAVVLGRRAGAARQDLRRLGTDLIPYLLIVAVVLVTRLVPEIKSSLGEIVLQWSYRDRFSGSFAPLLHPGTIVLASVVAAALVTGRRALVLAALGAAARRLLPVALALLVMLTLSRTMVLSGMIETLAQSAAGAGGVWPLLAPTVGTIGTFVSGSATASNIIFTQFQVSTAETLGLSLVLMMAAQAAGAAIGNLVAPHNIIAGGATVGLTRQEGAILRLTAPASLVCLAVAGGLAFLAVSLDVPTP